jgi:ABC-type lipoprotein export system ATPase subunit
MLQLKNVSKYYHSNDVVAMGLSKINVSFELGEFVAVTGESGSGKSTLLNVISGLDTYEDGELYINGDETSYFSIEDWERYRRQYIGFVFQEYNIIDSYSVYENVMVALSIQGYDQEHRKERALELIRRVGLESHTHHKASKLSGGQKQRAVIARALAKDCPIIVADEPTGNLDTESSDNIIKLLKEISKDKLVIVVTHNYDEVADYATRKIRLFDGGIVEDKKIKPHAKPTHDPVIESYQMTMQNSLSIAAKNLLRTPKRSIFTIVIALFIAIIFTFSFGGYVQNTSGGTNFYGGGIFQNMTDKRIVLTNFDGSPFTQSELDEIRDMNRVLSVLDHDVIMDSTINYYQENEEWDWIDERNFYINPANMLKTSDLKDGRLPTNRYEVVISENSEFEVGQALDLSTVQYYLYYEEGFELTDLPSEAYTIVGMTNTASTTWEMQMYFHDDVVNDDSIIERAYLFGRYGQGYVTLDVETTYEDPVTEEPTTLTQTLQKDGIQLDETLDDGTIEVQESYFYELADRFGIEIDDAFSEELFDYTLHISTNFHSDELPITVTMHTDNNRYVAVSEDVYERLLPNELYQVSVLVEDAYDASLVIASLELQGYNAIYPSNVTDMFTEITNLISGIFFGVLMTALMVVIYFISYIVLRNVQNAKKKDYLVFRSIGASQKALNIVTIFELVFAFLIAIVITMSFLIINQYVDTFVPDYLRYFKVSTYVIVIGILLLLAVLLGNRFNKKIFGNSVITALKQE